MPRDIILTNRFKKDDRRELKPDQGLDRSLDQGTETLVFDLPLAERHVDHALSGNWRAYRDCHIKPDLLLICRELPDSLELTRRGSHSELF